MRTIRIAGALVIAAASLIPGPRADAKAPPKLELSISNFRFCQAASCTPLEWANVAPLWLAVYRSVTATRGNPKGLHYERRPVVRGAGLPPSLKLRRTAEALAEAGQPRPVWQARH